MLFQDFIQFDFVLQTLLRAIITLVQKSGLGSEVFFVVQFARLIVLKVLFKRSVLYRFPYVTRLIQRKELSQQNQFFALLVEDFLVI